ncbi:TPA: hypothetical protein MYL17_005172 [Klebsiella pneumoniae]|uniref:hypothetical protein n=1 Tax=Klebsiella pneumoniae TaxID=573 RepID=UPI0013CF174D|nr:hypothetical protein [Klebsiella pneumoniae]WJU41565.1 hypothetical protein QU747_26215 [Klebsiella pneumoniae]WLX55073.1 hypothetical protein RA207_26350 [Klebsiella pneumoniae]HCA9919235.1 hypothetical protein [Klebsiella pneumoniae]HCB0113149.1 hypothetical protein [Klebsiella pneumoniae]HCU1213076.1 hypothetical protein [Klebsiella pneumoniae]
MKLNLLIFPAGNGLRQVWPAGLGMALNPARLMKNNSSQSGNTVGCSRVVCISGAR